MPSPDEVVTAFLREWDAEHPDVQKLLAYFAEDAVWHNIPFPPAQGKAAIEQALAGLGDMTSKGWEVKCQAVQGNVVMNERVDRFEVGGRPVRAQVCGVFEIDGEGKIAAWRDYFDAASFQKQMGG